MDVGICVCIYRKQEGGVLREKRRRGMRNTNHHTMLISPLWVLIHLQLVVLDGCILPLLSSSSFSFSLRTLCESLPAHTAPLPPPSFHPPSIQSDTPHDLAFNCTLTFLTLCSMCHFVSPTRLWMTQGQGLYDHYALQHSLLYAGSWILRK